MRFELKRHSKKNKPRTAADLHKKNYQTRSFEPMKLKTKDNRKTCWKAQIHETSLGGKIINIINICRGFMVHVHSFLEKKIGFTCQVPML